MVCTQAAVSLEKLSEVRAREEDAFLKRIPRSRALLERSKALMPNGVAQTWFYSIYRRAPIFVSHGRGPWFEDVDGNRYVDFNLADLAFTQAYGERAVADAVADQQVKGAHFLLPTEDSIAVAEILRSWTGLPFWQFTVSASGANIEAIRIARHATKREKIIVFDGHYHGHIDDTMVERGRERGSRPSHLGFLRDTGRNTIIVPFNNLAEIEAELAHGDIACVLTEPALTNVTLVLPEEGFHGKLRALTRRYGTLLVIDEAHTVQMAYGGLARQYRLEPDIVTYGKGFGSGHTLGAYGLIEPLARLIEADTDLHLGDRPRLGLGGTLFGTALAFAAVRATLETVLTPASYAHAAKLGGRLADGIDRTIAKHGLPWRAQRLNARSGISLFPENPRSGAEGMKSMDANLVDARRVYLANRGVWDAISSAGPQAGFGHRDEDVDLYVSGFDQFLSEIV